MKLHELLAVETNLETQSNKTRADLLNTFDKKRHLFESKTILYTPNGENEKPVVESQSDIQSNVKKELDWVRGHIAKALDSSYQVAEANTRAKADIILDDDANTVLASNVPATALLELEKRIAEISSLVNSIPTNDPAKGFIYDDASGLYKAREIRKNRTKKVKTVLILYKHTEQHPAQTQLIDEDVVTGTIVESEMSGLITPSTKADMLARVDMVARAVRRARSRANECEVNTANKIGKHLLNYILG